MHLWVLGRVWAFVAAMCDVVIVYILFSAYRRIVLWYLIIFLSHVRQRIDCGNQMIWLAHFYRVRLATWGNLATSSRGTLTAAFASPPIWSLVEVFVRSFAKRTLACRIHHALFCGILINILSYEWRLGILWRSTLWNIRIIHDFHFAVSFCITAIVCIFDRW